MGNLAQPLVMMRADLESRLTDDHHDALRLWLRLLTCTTLIERGIRRRLRERYGMTLARFDLMAQLERFPSGLRMGELSRRLMVTGGNVTGLVAQLVDEGLVEKRRGRGMFVTTGARTQLLKGERERFLEHEWPRIAATIDRLGFDAADLLKKPGDAD